MTRVIDLDDDDLRAIIRDELAVALADQRRTTSTTAPALVDRRGLATALAISIAAVDRLRADGCPEVRIGSAPRFEVAAVVEWLRLRSTAEPLRAIDGGRRGG